MKRFVLALFCLASLACAEEEPLVPASLNALMPKITAGMTSDQIKAIVVKSYAKTEKRDGPWSGQSGYLGFRLDERFSFEIAAHTNAEGKQVVSEDARIYIYDWKHKRRLEIVQCQWESDSKVLPPAK